MKTKSGFTLIELLVVISIIAVLTSVLFIRVSLAQSKARDTARIQQVSQIDLATKLYTEQEGHAPNFNGLCDAQSAAPTLDPASACFTISTSGTVGGNWDKFKAEINPYLSDIPNDPCPSCDSDSGLAIGYTYIPPLLVQYQCARDNGGTCPLPQSQLSGSYQIYAPLEKKTTPAGNSSNGTTTLYKKSVVPTPLPKIDEFGFVPGQGPGIPRETKSIYFVVSNATSCTVTDTQFGNSVTVSSPVSAPTKNWITFYNVTANESMTLMCSGPGGNSFPPEIRPLIY